MSLPSQVCITIIDTIILTIYTNNAYYCDTYNTSWGPVRSSGGGYRCSGHYSFRHHHRTHHQVCITIIDTIILHIHTNNAYYYDTYVLTISSLEGEGESKYKNKSGLDIAKDIWAIKGPQVGVYVTCITIIDTIIRNYTQLYWIFTLTTPIYMIHDTYTPLRDYSRGPSSAPSTGHQVSILCITIIDTIIHNYTVLLH
jgi:hypothetical protein